MECDKNCAKHGKIRTHGRSFTGIVVSTKMSKTATIEWQRTTHIPKYERYTQNRTRVKAHNPACIDAKKGDVVKIMETRPLSRTKHFVILEKMGKQKLFETKQDLLEKSKHREEEKDERGKSENN